MYSWRITKYNPYNRDKDGIYLKDEWTSFSDIGCQYDGNEFTYNDYLLVERSYIEAVKEFMSYLKISSLEICNLEKHFFLDEITKLYINIEDHNLKKMLDLFNVIENRTNIEINQIETLCQLILREHLWCELSAREPYLTVKFGYDYYMYIETFSDCQEIIKKITKSRLYVEPYEALE